MHNRPNSGLGEGFLSTHLLYCLVKVNEIIYHIALYPTKIDSFNIKLISSTFHLFKNGNIYLNCDNVIMLRCTNLHINNSKFVNKARPSESYIQLIQSKLNVSFHFSCTNDFMKICKISMTSLTLRDYYNSQILFAVNSSMYTIHRLLYFKANSLYLNFMY